VRTLLALGILLVAAFVYLRIYGVPKPVLQEVVRRVNASGIPVEIEDMTLTLRGWRADRVKYYSRHPDDLEAILDIDRIFFTARTVPWHEGISEWHVDVRAEGIRLHPSVEWGIELPAESPSKYIEQMDVSVYIRPDQVQIMNGRLKWLGSRVQLNGTVVKLSGQPKPAEEAWTQDTVSPIHFTQQQFQHLENRLKALSMPGGAEVDIDFLIDMNNYSANRVDFSVQTQELVWRDFPFSKAEMTGRYAYPTLQLQRVALFQDQLSVALKGAYNLESKSVQGSLFNTLKSRELLLLLPEPVNAFLVRAEMGFEHLPRMELDFGPSPVTNMLSRVSGGFSVQGLSYKDITAETLRGKLRKQDGRWEFEDLQALLLGREPAAAKTGSGMRGGRAEGRVFWDSDGHEFGVTVDGNFDPNLLLQSLARVPVANQVIQRFQFREQPPKVHVEMGANTRDWSTFQIKVHALVNDVLFQGILCNSMNFTAFYKRGKLQFDPVAVMQGGRFMKGSATLDFVKDIATFDVQGSMHPEQIEDMICPKLDLFGKTLRVSGDVRIDTRGTFDWGSMQSTDLKASVAAGRFETPVAATDHFKAEIVWKGPRLHIKDAQFGVYGGHGRADFSIRLDPAIEARPYELDLEVVDADFKQCLQHISPEKKIGVSGFINATAHVEADLSTNFFASARGAGSLQVANGQLADLPLLKGFSRLMRVVIPGFSVFSITSLSADFTVGDGVVSSDNAYFGGDIISARGRGSYNDTEGFDVYIHAQIFKDSGLGKVVRVITDPLMRFLEFKLEGPVDDPAWRLEKFPGNISDIFRRKKE